MQVTIDADQLDEILDGVEDILGEGVLRFREDKIVFKATDPAQVAFIDLEIPEDSLETYEPELEQHEDFVEDDELLIGVSLENMEKAVGLFDEQVELSLDESKLVMREGTNRITLPVLELDTDLPATEDMDFEAEGDLSVSKLKELVKKAGFASDNVRITFEQETVFFEAESNQVTVEDRFELDAFESGEEESVTSMYAMNYVKPVMKAFKGLDTCEFVRVRMGEEFPISFVHESERENLEIFIAPRIEEDAA